MSHLIYILAGLGAVVLSVWVTWGLFVLVMGLYRAKLNGELTHVAYGLGLPYLGIGLAADFLLNVTLATLIFLDIPRDLLLTGRLKRYMANPDLDWRHALALKICHGLLDSFDPSGKHC